MSRRNRTLYLDDDLLAATAELGKKNRRSLSAEIEVALEKHLGSAGITVTPAPEEKEPSSHNG